MECESKFADLKMRNIFSQSPLFWLLQYLLLLEVSPLQSLDFNTILPPNPEEYDNLQPPKEDEQTPTIVRFHVTVLSIDSIDEGSMVR
ncbi:glycine receptor subunit alpha-2 [Nephila pilipes]|uniref:Glycine receptor subunit alpha-2 n=1 Tax=Nephila pilipes TaxID=299642 RepID=A0A8X6IHJ6_NEPPI|nr:glycine receptor subunit alpha-2 [Nephila pilipes]